MFLRSRTFSNCRLCSKCSYGMSRQHIFVGEVEAHSVSTTTKTWLGLRLQVSANFNAGDGLQSTYDWLVLFCSMLGSKFFGMGCAASFILGNNLGYAQQLAAWKAQGKLGSPPRLVCHCKQPAFLSCIFCGTAVFLFVKELVL